MARPARQAHEQRAIQRQIVARSTEAFGRAIWPHLFRAIAVTELADCAPDEIGIAHDLLGHADLRTARAGRGSVAADHEEVNRQRREETAARAGKERELTEVRRLWHVGGHLRVEPDRRRARRIVLATGIELAQAAE